MQHPCIIVSGRNGQVGSEIAGLSVLFPQYRFVFLGRDQLDITKGDALENIFNSTKPAWFINAAAYTAVDKAETDQQQAYLVNAEAPGTIARYCHHYGTMLVHISTDYVFDGAGNASYTEQELTRPINYYGYSKSAGEQLALQNNPATIVLRTSWVYSRFGNNFVKTMLRLMNERDEINVVNDQLGAPTWANDLANAILTIIEISDVSAGSIKSGIYHYTNSGITSWYDFAVAIRDAKGLSCKINPIPTSQFHTAAKRPGWSVLNTEKIRAAFNLQIPDWRESLEKCLAQL